MRILSGWIGRGAFFNHWAWGGCLAILICGGLFGCTEGDGRLFTRLSSSETGVDFANETPREDSLLKALQLNHVFSEGGVAAGDVNGDGRPDLYFTGALGKRNELYINKGGFQFEKATETAGVGMEKTWSKGVALVDINQDGRQDLYVCVGGPAEGQSSRANRLYVNQGVNSEGLPTFEDQAAEYGLDDPGYSVHAAFFDYDRDGDLDLYLLNSSSGERGKVSIGEKKIGGEAVDTDRLYRNNGDGTFTNVSAEAGIQIEGHGLGVAISDVNKDGWPDIYLANDFVSNDILYINNGDGTFTNRIREQIQYQPYSAMGVDVADVNNDTWNDVMVLDMLPADRERDHMMSRFFDQSAFERSLQFGYEPQYVRNMLQLNNGPTPEGELSFSEIGQMAGVASTNWSWAPLLVDFDNDGHRDLFVSNGYGKNMTNLDFVRRRQNIRAFGSEETQRKEVRKEVSDLSAIKIRNYFFENEGNLTFAERTDRWVDSSPGLSTGAAVADLDGDGDLDVVTNNMNEEATILENRASRRDSANALRVDLHGSSENRGGLGTKLTLYNDSTTQYYEHFPYRGYQSTVQPVAHFGLGADSTADSLEVVWPDGKTQLLTNVGASQVLDVRYKTASFPKDEEASSNGRSDSLLFREVSEERGLVHRHREREVNEFEQTPILPHKLSMEGPGLAVGDVDGNGLDDVYVGADWGNRPVLFRQMQSRQFQADTLNFGKRFEDRGALFFDANGDGHQDLYVVSGGPIRAADSTVYQDRLYLNDGTGSLQRADGALPDISAAGSVVTAADYDRDGDLDLFVGGRVRPGEYPLPPRSYLLRNDSDGEGVQFTDVTADAAPALTQPGLVTDALWTDYNSDGRTDLLVVGEWMPISIFENGPNGFTEVTDEVGLGGTSGWWMSLASGDFDQDGDTDYVAGNLGLNTRYETSPEAPMKVHAKDYDRDGTIDPVLTEVANETRYSVPRRDEMIKQIPGLKGRFPTYREYAEAPFEDVFQPSEREGAYVREVVRFETSVLENRGKGTFGVRSLPRRTQMAPVFGMETGDYDGDGSLDLLTAGNWYAPNVRTGRAGAFIGAYLRSDGTGHFTVQDGTESGFFVDGDAKATARVATENGTLVLVTQNDDSLKAFRSWQSDSVRTVQLRPLDQSATLHFESGETRRAEFYYGSSYLSQSSRVLRVPPNVQKVVITNSMGDQRTLAGGKGSVAAAGE